MTRSGVALLTIASPSISRLGPGLLFRRRMQSTATGYPVGTTVGK